MGGQLGRASLRTLLNTSKLYSEIKPVALNQALKEKSKLLTFGERTTVVENFSVFPTVL